jgi:cell division protein FtsI/penicillin-binding protein 2
MKKSRLVFLIAGVFLIYGSIIFNLYRLQIQKGDYYTVRAQLQAANERSDLVRGNIYFTDKYSNLIPAAMNKEHPVIFAVPQDIEDVETTAALLSPIIGVEIDRLRTVLSKPNDLYELLAVKVAEETAAKVQSLGLTGIYVDRQNFRFYPFGSLAAQLLGFMGLNDQDNKLMGRYGLERYFDDELSRRDLILTVDRNIQSQAEEVLKNFMENYGASGGTVIVQNPKSGAILALGNYPNFDPNEYSEYPIGSYLNPAIEFRYEPGSVFKVITMAAGIDAGRITPATKYYDAGFVTLDGWTIKNWDFDKKGAYGWATMTKALEHSINTGAVFAEQKTGHDNFYNYLLKFGFNELTGIALPGEVTGNLKNLKTGFRNINFATASFGQGVAVAPMALINAVSAIANDGVLMKPRLIKDEKPEVIRRVISSETAKAVTQMMVLAVKSAQVAQIPNYTIAGKTGTAFIPDLKRGGYTEEVINTYVGFVPASDPAFTILIKIDKPRGAPVAALTVVPAFRELAQFILNYYGIGPDDLAVSD